MARRGRPFGSGYDDAERIRRVRVAMATGLSRRAAILRLCGPDQLRRIEVKMRIVDMSEDVGRHVARVIQATLVGMGCGDGEVEVVSRGPCAFDAPTLYALIEEARRLGFRLVGPTARAETA